MEKFANFFSIELIEGLGPQGESIKLSQAGYEKYQAVIGLPDINGLHDTMTLVLEDAEGSREIIKAGTASSGKGVHLLQIERGQEGTEPRAWPAGARAENRLTAAWLGHDPIVSIAASGPSSFTITKLSGAFYTVALQ